MIYTLGIAVFRSTVDHLLYYCKFYDFRSNCFANTVLVIGFDLIKLTITMLSSRLNFIKLKQVQLYT